MQNKQPESKIIKEEPAFEAKWLGLKYLSFSIGEKVVQKYESVYRMTRKKNCDIDGVQVVPIINYKEKPSQMVLIANFRPPTMKFCLEFPAGLLDDTNFEENAKREVEEETGYVVEKFTEIPLPAIYCDPWKSNESAFMYIGTINGDDPNSYKGQKLDSEENIKVIKVPFDENLMKNVSEIAKQNDYIIESKLWSVCLGLWMAKCMK